MTTQAQTRAGGEKIKHVSSAKATRQQVHLTQPPPPARKSMGQAKQQQQGLVSAPPARKSTGQAKQQQQGLVSVPAEAATTTTVQLNDYSAW
jgi:hypothetical protein